MNKTKILFAGETWCSNLTEGKGFNFFSIGMYEEAVEYIKNALEIEEFEFFHLPAHKVPDHFPTTKEELNTYDVIMLSDIGADSLLLSSKVFTQSQRINNRLKLLKEFVANGGGLCMIGGYMSFQGIEGKGRYHNTPIEKILPVEIFPYDDRKEVPEGFNPKLVNKNHAVTAGIPDDWPYLLGYNRLKLKEDGILIASYESDPIVAAYQYKAGRTMIFASDCAPHWGSPDFCSWEFYPKFWRNTVNWLADKK